MAKQKPASETDNVDTTPRTPHDPANDGLAPDDVANSGTAPNTPDDKRITEWKEIDADKIEASGRNPQEYIEEYTKTGADPAGAVTLVSLDKPASDGTVSIDLGKHGKLTGGLVLNSVPGAALSFAQG